MLLYIEMGRLKWGDGETERGRRKAGVLCVLKNAGLSSAAAVVRDPTLIKSPRRQQLHYETK